MELIDYLTLSVFFGLGFAIGWRLNNYIHVSALRQLMKDLGITDQQLLKVARNTANELGVEAQEKVRKIEEAVEDRLEQIDIKVEKHGEMLYAFRKDNDAFLGQGIDKDSLIEAMKHRVKGVRMTVVEGDEYLKSEA